MSYNFKFTADCSRRMYGGDDEQKLTDFDVEEMILNDGALFRGEYSAYLVFII